MRGNKNQVFNKVLCRYQDLIKLDNRQAFNKNRDPSMKLIWTTKTNPNKILSNINIVIHDPCSFAIGSMYRHLYDFFLITQNPFEDKYPKINIKSNLPKKKQTEKISPKNKNINLINEFKLNIDLKNARIILLRDLTNIACDALVTQGSIKVSLNMS